MGKVRPPLLSNLTAKCLVIGSFQDDVGGDTTIKMLQDYGVHRLHIRTCYHKLIDTLSTFHHYS
jgi:hypothetical protein